jgi:hypothetical protein
MGRYCYFSNGFEYKFWFGEQPSGFDFLRRIITLTETEIEEGIVEFSLSFEKNKMLTHLERYDLELPEFEEYDKSIEGTHVMYESILNNICGGLSGANFSLACILYHMSLYDTNISGTYEL